MQDIQAARLAMERFQNHGGGVIRFGLPPIIESYLFPNFFIHFREANPKIVLDLQEYSDSMTVHEKLDDDELDFGIIFLNPDDNLKNSLPLMEDEFYLCLPASHKQNLVALQRSASAGFAPDVLLSTSQIKTIKELVSSNAAVALIPHFAITDSANFKAVPVAPPIKFTIALAWNSLKELSPLFRHFLNFVDDIFHKK